MSIDKLMPETEPPQRWTVTGAAGDPTDEGVRSAYVEDYWLTYLGPTALVLARKLDAALAYQNRVAVPIKTWGESLGVHPDDIGHALYRLIRYGLATEGEGENHVCLLRHWPEVPAAITTSPHRAALTALNDMEGT